MKNIKIILSVLLILPSVLVNAQNTDVKAELASARSSYSSGDLEDARFALERSLNELNNVIAKEIRSLLPAEIGGLPAFKPEDETIGNAGGAGIFINRTYKTDGEKTVEVTISDHSPMIAMVNSFMSNSMLNSVLLAESGQKSVKVSGYKGMFETTEGDEGGVAYLINIPFGDSLLTVETEGVDSEEDALAMAGEVPLDQIAALVK